MENKTNKVTVSKIREFLKEIGTAYSLKNREHYIDRIEQFNRIVKFPWREDQKEIIEKIIENKEKYYVINGIFGCGKTTLLFGVLINLIIRKIISPEEIMFISFNLCIRNEIKRKLKPFGFKGKIRATTFDSIIYQICKLYKYPYLDLPNFDGKRRFCYEKCEKGEIKPFSLQPKLIFIDEVQDLEKNTLIIFKSFFPETKIVFAGDVFQSIQKEPRESLLWDLLHNKDPKVKRFYMKITPRVPKNILSNLQKTLIEYYPEFDNEISKWVSTNEISDATVKWNRFYSYSQIFDITNKFIKENGEVNTMILTFSSAITVKGALGDISRLRRELIQNYDLNKDHKKLEPDKLFLSTSNSSKGLERDHVLVLLTFPLEKAFSNFSNDIVINLITVAITRARKSVHFYIPAYEDKFTELLRYFKDCPLPNKKKIREVKNLSDFTVQDYLDAEKCVTELIKQNIIFYDTRIELKQFIKRFESERLFDGEITVKRPLMPCEEERVLVGVIIENLMTSTWSGKWPFPGQIENLRNHPMYIHIFKRIESNYNKYCDYIRKNNMENISNHVKGIYLYSQLHLAMYNKLFMTFPSEFIQKIEDYWKALKLKIKSIRPKSNKLMIQTNLRMPWVTGIADAIFETKSIINDKEYDEINIWEIKASIDPNWKDNALTQGFLYALMTGKTWSRITLINPFRNEKCSYYFNSKNILSFRNKVYRDVLTWNLNCYLSKSYNSRNSKILDIKDCFFVNINYHYRECNNCKNHKKYIILKPCSHHLCCECVKQINKCPLCDEIIDKILLPQVSQLTLVEMLSPTKSFVRTNKYFNTYFPEGKLTRQEKLSNESTESYSENWVGSVHRRIWIAGKSVKGCDDIRVFFPGEIEFKEIFKYQKNPELRYSLDFDDGLVKIFSYIILLSREYKFI